MKKISVDLNEITEVSTWIIIAYDQWEAIWSGWCFHNIQVWDDNYLICYHEDWIIWTFVSTFKMKFKVEEFEYWQLVHEEDWHEIELYIDWVLINSQNYKDKKIPNYTGEEDMSNLDSVPEYELPF